MADCECNRAAVCITSLSMAHRSLFPVSISLKNANLYMYHWLLPCLLLCLYDNLNISCSNLIVKTYFCPTLKLVFLSLYCLSFIQLLINSFLPSLNDNLLTTVCQMPLISAEDMEVSDTDRISVLMELAFSGKSHILKINMLIEI